MPSCALAPSWHHLCLLLIACLLTSVSAASSRRTKRGEGNEFFFEKFPLENHVESGHSVRLRCRVNRKENIGYHWTHDGRALVSTSRRYQQGSDLVIGNADPELDRGNFHCVATNKTSGYTSRSSAYTLKIYWMDPAVSVALVSPELVSNIVQDAEVVLECRCRAQPPVTGENIRWFHNFQRLKGKSASEKNVKILANGRLRIKKYQRGNAGVYRCQVLHPAGLVMATSPLTITAKDQSPYYSVAKEAAKYLQYYRRNDVLKLSCPIKMEAAASGFIQWSYRRRLDLASDVKTFDSSNCMGGDDCVLSRKESFVLRRRPSRRGSGIRHGFYKCQLLLTGKHPSSKSYVIEVRKAENPALNASNLGLRYPLEKVVPKTGSSHIIRVYVDLTRAPSGHQIVADPRPNFKWILPNGDIVDSRVGPSARIHMKGGQHLYFSTVQPGDSGLYRLAVTNADSSQEARVHVVVAFPPSLKAAPVPNVTVMEGPSNLTLRCNVAKKAAFPVAKALWFKDGAVLDEVSASPLSFLRPSTDGRIAYSSTSISIPAQAPVRFTLDRNAGVVAFRSIIPGDSGTYQCVIRTKGFPDVKSNEFHVKVLRRLRITVIDPQPFLERSLSSKLTCRAKGEAPLVFTWLRKNPATGRFKNIKAGGKTGRLDFVGKWDLDFPLVKNEDAGQYMCRVTDRLGAVANATYNVVVGEKPTITSSTRRNITAVEGQTIRLECSAAGDPPPKTSWIRHRADKATESLTLDTFHGVDPRRTHRMLFENGTLLIRNVVYADSGVYQCVAGHKHAMTSGSEIHVRVTMRNGDNLDGEGSDGRRRSPLTKTILIVVGCALAYLGLIVALTVYCSLRMVRKRRKYTEAIMTGPGTKAELAAAAAAESQRLMSNGEFAPSNNNVSGGHVSPSASSQYSRTFGGVPGAAPVVDPSIPPYPRSRLIKTASLGKGEFGEVFLARAPVLCAPDGNGEPEILVTVKTLQHSKDRRLTASFYEQLEMFHKLDHRSVVQLLGACLDSEPRCFLLEFCAWGDLKQFLRAMRRGQQPQEPPPFTAQPLSPSQRMHLCSQVANGMEHISNLRFVHKDLAARNVLISPNLDVKISHLGLSQSVYAEDYFPIRFPGTRSSRPVPIRWMPPEVILKGAYSPETDVWSFGIFVYEVLSLGEAPLRKHSHSEILSAAAAGRLSPELPPACSPELQALLLRCWSERPDDRPTFSEVSVVIGGMVAECNI